MGRWVRVDRRYNQPYRLTGYARRAIFKWLGLILAWVVINSVLSAAHLGLLVLVTTAGLIWHAVHSFVRAEFREPSVHKDGRSQKSRLWAIGSTRPLPGQRLRLAGRRLRGGSQTHPGHRHLRNGSSGHR